MRVTRMEPLTGVLPFVLGVCLVRGVPTPVVDVAMLVTGQRSPPARLVTIDPDPGGQAVPRHAGGRVVALAVDEVIGVRVIPAGTADGLSRLLGGAASEVTSAIGALDAQVLLVLNDLSVVSELAWRAMAGAESPS